MLVLALLHSACQQPEVVGKVVVYPFTGVDSTQVEMVLADLTTEEKIGQLIVWETSVQDSVAQNDLISQVAGGRVGGVLMKNLSLKDFLYTADSLKRSAKLPLLFGTKEKVSLHNQFTYMPRFPLPASMAAIDSSGLHRLMEQQYLRQCKALGINFCLNPTLKMDDPASTGYDFQTFENEEMAILERSEWMAKSLKRQRILAFGDNFSDFLFIEADSVRDSLLLRYQLQTRAGLSGLIVDDKAFRADTLKYAPAHFVKNYLKQYLDFNGLMVTQLSENESPEQKLLEGADLFITPDAGKAFQGISKLIASGKITAQDLDRRVRLVLRAKAWVNGGRLPVEMTVLPIDSVQQPVKLVSLSEKRSPKVYSRPAVRPAGFEDRVEAILCYFEDPGWGYFIGDLFENSVILARDNQGNIPFKNVYDTDFQVYTFGRQAFNTFGGFFEKYAGFKDNAVAIPPSGELNAIRPSKLGDSSAVVVLLDSIDLQPGFHQAFIKSVNVLAGKTRVVLVNFGNPKNLRFFDSSISSIQIFERNDRTEAYVAQLLFGGVPSEGRLPVALNQDMPFGTVVHHPAQRLGFASAEKTGIAAERLVGINAIAETAIDKGIFPGCQVVVAKDGNVIYSQSFGQQTYGKKGRAVSTNDLYDIASLTKVSATTLAVMKLVESQKIDLKGKIGDYLQLKTSSALRSIGIRELLLHSSGLQAQMPLTKFYAGRNVPARGCNSIYCRKRRGSYGVKVADGLYLRNDYTDTIWNRVYNLPVAEKKKYRYSDVNFYLLQKIVEKQTNTRLDKYVFENFYRPLGLRHTLYKPLEKFGRADIVPTERDNYWRKTLVHGYVHDPAAALMGGVGGNSGVFSNAEDLAVLFQMLLNKGVYGGVQYFQPGTLDDFTQAKYTNHRGLGFDKPVNRRYPTYSRHASPATYGHTGFTGTCVWVDPEQRLVYVFLSNRIHPSARNGKIFTEETRSRIHEVVYDALGTFQSKLPELTVGEEELLNEEGE